MFTRVTKRSSRSKGIQRVLRAVRPCVVCNLLHVRGCAQGVEQAATGGEGSPFWHPVSLPTRRRPTGASGQRMVTRMWTGGAGLCVVQ
jgi:hypothetical protein